MPQKQGNYERRQWDVKQGQGFTTSSGSAIGSPITRIAKGGKHTSRKKPKKGGFKKVLRRKK